MNDLIPFDFNGATIRAVIGDDGEPLFVARDIAVALAYTNPSKAVGDHCKGVTKRDLPTAGGIQSSSVIPERDVYRLIMRSKLPAAERFEEWVVGEVLPSIRKTGAYNPVPAIDLNDPEFLRSTLLTYTEKVIQLQQTITEQAPKVAFVDKYATAEGNKGVREVVKLLDVNEREFVAFLVGTEIMYRLNGRLTAYAHHQHAGRFVVKTGIGGNERAFTQSLFTAKGVQWIAQKWAEYQSAHSSVEAACTQ